MLEPHLAPINTLQIPLAKVTQLTITGRQRSFTATAADPSALPSNPFGPSPFETPPEVQPVQELTWLPFQGRVAVAALCAAVMYTQRLVRRSHHAAEPPGNPEDDQPPCMYREPKGDPGYRSTPRCSWPDATQMVGHACTLDTSLTVFAFALQHAVAFLRMFSFELHLVDMESYRKYQR